MGLRQGVFFYWSPPKFDKYKIPLYALALREIPGQLTWDFVLRKFRGQPVKKKHPVAGASIFRQNCKKAGVPLVIFTNCLPISAGFG